MKHVPTEQELTDYYVAKTPLQHSQVTPAWAYDELKLAIEQLPEMLEEEPAISILELAFRAAVRAFMLGAHAEYSGWDTGSHDG